jgi:ribose 5-phosphate isomerase A
LNLDKLRRRAAERAVNYVESGMVIGLGTGRTVHFVIAALAERIAAGLKIMAIPTSARTEAEAGRLGIPLTSFVEHCRIDLAIDGADEVARGTLDLVKGGGGALLREKIVAAASDRFVVVVDEEKLVDRLGEHMPVPVEVTQFGWQASAAAIERLGGSPVLRQMDARPFVTDGGNFILDCRFGAPLDDPGALECRLNMTPGVVDNGLFVARSSAVVVAYKSGVEILTRGAEAKR